MTPTTGSDWAGMLAASYWRDALWFCCWSIGLAIWFGWLLRVFLRSAGIHPEETPIKVFHIGKIVAEDGDHG